MIKTQSRIQRGDIYLISLDPTVGSETKKTRPCVIVSNNLQNSVSGRVIIIPITSKLSQIYPFEVKIKVGNIEGKAMADQIRSIDKARLQKYLGIVNKSDLIKLEQAIKLVLNLE